MGLEPCPLCMTQRALIFIVGAIALIATIHNPADSGTKIYGAATASIALLGMAVAARHVWLQQLPDHLVPACGPSLEYMLKTLPFSETLQLIFMGDGNCAETVWIFAGLTIPQQTLGLFLILFGLSVVQFVKATE